MNVAKFTLSQIILVLVNLIPLLGVLFWGWDLGVVMILFWAENVVIGIYNVFKMITCAFFGTNRASFFPLIPFFIVHYGLFTFAHGIFVYAMFVKNDLTPSEEAQGSLFDVLAYMQDQSLLYPLLALVLSHGVSYFFNFILNDKYKTETSNTLMTQPYGRIMILHFTILAGGFIANALGQPVYALVFLIVLKTIIDLTAHTLQNLSKPKDPVTP